MHGNMEIYSKRVQPRLRYWENLEEQTFELRFEEWVGLSLIKRVEKNILGRRNSWNGQRT